MARNRSADDRAPYPLTLRFPLACDCCQRQLQKGDSVFRYPLTKTHFCYDGPRQCGETAERDHLAMRADEEMPFACFNP